MINLSTLSPCKGSRKKPKRVGRGDASGHGGTSGRGHKGQNARSGRRKRHPLFEGGQTPLSRRLPKRGFKNIFRVDYKIVNVGDLNIFEPNQRVGVEELLEKGLIRSRGLVKILGKGELDRALEVRAHKFSSSAQKKIISLGGKAEVIV